MHNTTVYMYDCGHDIPKHDGKENPNFIPVHSDCPSCKSKSDQENKSKLKSGQENQ